MTTYVSQAPPPGGILADPNAYYTATFSQAAPGGWLGYFVNFQNPDTSVTLVVSLGVGDVPNWAPGWEGVIGGDATTLIIQFRPVGGWVPSGDYTGPALQDGLIASIQIFDALESFFLMAAPQWDFKVGAVAPAVDLLVVGDRRVELDASAWVAASGTLGRRDRVATVTRTGPGVYVVAFEAGRGRSLADFDITVQTAGAAPRAATLDVQGQQVTVRTFDAGGAPADSNFSLAVRRT